MKQKIRYAISAILLGLLIGFLYNRIVIPDSYRKDIFCYKHSVKVKNSNYVEMAFPIPHKETYLLKISSPEDKKKKIVVNDNILIPWKTKFYHKKYSKSVDYILISPEKLNIGKNYLKIYLSSNISTWVTMRLGNYKGNSSNKIFVLFKDSHILSLKRNYIACLYLALIVLFLFLLWVSRFLFIEKVGIREKICFKIFISLLPVNLLFFLAYIIPATLGLRLFVTSGYFWTLQAVSLGLVCCVFFYKYSKKMIIKIVLCHLRWIKTFWQWLKPRPFSDKCIILFMFLPIVSALLLTIRLEKIAERLAIVAYFVLCLSVVIKFVQLVRKKDRKKDR